MSDLKKTILHDLHVRLGAQMAPFGGFIMPIQYTGIIAEHQAARTGATLFDTCHMGEIRVGGGRALADLEALVSCDIASLEPGQCRYGLMCNENGGVRDDLLVYRQGADAFMLVVNAATRETDFEWVRAHVSAGIRAENLSGRMAKIDLQGPGAPKIMQALMKNSIAGLKFYRFMDNMYRGRPVLVSRTGYTGEIGYEFFGDLDLAEPFWNDCMERGAVPAGLGARDTLRLEMGMPLYGHELSEGRNAAESGFTRALSSRKPYIGSDAIRDQTQAASCLSGLELEGRRACRHGDGILDGDGKIVGEVTSGSFAPSLGKAVALGYVAREWAGKGRHLTISTARGPLRAVVAELPFYRQATGRRPIAEFL